MERVYTTPLLDKLGIRPGMRVALIDIDDPDDPAAHRGPDDRPDRGHALHPSTDVVLLGAETPAELAPLATLATRIRPNGAIWVVSRKGKAATLRYADLLDAAKAAGLVDNKVASFSRDAHGPAPRHPRRAPTEVSATVRSTALALRALYHPPMPDLLLILIIILIVVVVWRGPKTLPKLGEALGRGVKEAKSEATKAQAEIQARTDDKPPTDASGDRPA